MDISIKELDMRQVSNELARIRQSFVERINQVRFHHLIALLYVAIALAILISPQQAAFGWLLTTHGIEGDFLSFMFAGSAIVIANNPQKKWFAVCLIPLAVYLLIFSAYAINTSYFSFQVGVLYIASLMVLIWTLQFHSLGKLKLHHVLSFVMAMIGVAIFDSPNRGVVGWIFQNYGTPSQALGLVLILSALWMALDSKRDLFWPQTVVFSFYVSASVWFSLRNVSAGWVGVAIALTFAVSLLWAYRHTHKYYEVP